MTCSAWNCCLANIQVVPPAQLSNLYSAACPPVHINTGAGTINGPGASTSKSISRAATPREASTTPLAVGAADISADANGLQQPVGQFLAGSQRDTPEGQEAGTRLALGQAIVLNSQPTGNEAGQSAGDADEDHANIDVLMFTGGLVWSTAFCPLQSHPSLQGAAAPAAADTQPAADEPPAAKRPRSGSHHTAATAAGRVHGNAAGACQQAGQQAAVLSPGAVANYAAAVQVWRGDGTPAQATELLAVAVHPGTPRCVAGLVHDGKVVWDLQWCPEPWQYLSSQGSSAAQQPDVRVVGILASALGDGSVQVWVVPDPTDALLQHHIHSSQHLPPEPDVPASPGRRRADAPTAAGDVQQHLQHSAQAATSSLGGAAGAAADRVGNGAGQLVLVGPREEEEAGAFPGLRVRPQVVLSAEQLGGGCASCVAWRIGKPHLLVGCWDGGVSLWQLPGSATQPQARLSPLLFIRADGTPVRRVLWHPVPVPDAGASTSNLGSEQAGAWLQSLDDVQQHLFMSCSQSGHVRIWDDRDTCCAVLDKVVSRTAVYDAVWVAGPQPGRVAVVVVLDDGTTRCLDFSPAHYYYSDKAGFISVMSGMDPACLWSVSYSGGLNLVAVAGEEGVVAVATMEQEHDNRMRKPHVPVGGIVSDRGVLRVLGPRQVAGLPCVYSGGASYSACFGLTSQAATTRKMTTSEMRDSVQTLYTVTWSPNVFSVPAASGLPRTSGAGAGAGVTLAGHGKRQVIVAPSSPRLTASWLAYGGLSGLVRCQRVGIDVD